MPWHTFYYNRLIIIWILFANCLYLVNDINGTIWASMDISKSFRNSFLIGRRTFYCVSRHRLVISNTKWNNCIWIYVLLLCASPHRTRTSFSINNSNFLLFSKSRLLLVQLLFTRQMFEVWMVGSLYVYAFINIQHIYVLNKLFRILFSIRILWNYVRIRKIWIGIVRIWKSYTCSNTHSNTQLQQKAAVDLENAKCYQLIRFARSLCSVYLRTKR